MRIARLGALTGFALLLFAPVPATATEILLYQQNASNQNAQAALDNLGLAYTVAGSTTFNGLLAAMAWDLVIMDTPSNIPQGGFDDLADYVDGGGAAIMSFWWLESHPVVQETFEAVPVDHFHLPQDVYSWDLGHPIWDGVGTLSAWSNVWGIDGNPLALPTSGVALGGFVPGAGTPDAAAIILSGNTIYNGFLFDEMTDANGVKLIENEISYLLPVPEPGTVLLLALGLLGAAARRMRR